MNRLSCSQRTSGAAFNSLAFSRIFRNAAVRGIVRRRAARGSACGRTAFGRRSRPRPSFACGKRRRAARRSRRLAVHVPVQRKLCIAFSRKRKRVGGQAAQLSVCGVLQQKRICSPAASRRTFCFLGGRGARRAFDAVKRAQQRRSRRCRRISAKLKCGACAPPVRFCFFYGSITGFAV